MRVEVGFSLAHATMHHLQLRLTDPKFINWYVPKFHLPCTTQHHPIPPLTQNRSCMCIWGGQTYSTWHGVEWRRVNGIPLNNYLTHVTVASISTSEVQWQSYIS